MVYPRTWEMNSTAYVSTGGVNAVNLSVLGVSIHQITGWNVSTSPVFIKFFNSTATPNSTADSPSYTLPVGAGLLGSSGAGGVGAGVTVPVSFPWGNDFPTGLGFTIVGGAANNSTANVAANAAGFSMVFEKKAS